MKKFEDARKCYLDENNGAETTESAECILRTGNVLKALDKKADAMATYEQALDIRITLFGEDHHETAKSYDSIAQLYLDLGEYERAGTLIERTYEIRKEQLEPDDRYMADSLGGLGAYSYYTGDYPAAIDYFTESEKIYIDTLGPEHPLTLVITANIGYTYIEIGDFESANLYLQKVLDSQKNNLGHDNPNTATTLEAIAINNYYTGNFDEASEQCKEAIDVYEKAFGKNHSSRSNCLIVLGVIYAALEDYGPALDYYTEALELNKATIGKMHPDTANLYNNIAAMMIDMGSYEKALEFANEALDIYMATSGESTPDVGYCYNALGRIYSRIGNYFESLKYHNKALDLRQRIFNEDSYPIAESYNNLAAVYEELSEMDLALEYYLKAADILQKVYGETHQHTAAVYSNIGRMYHIRGDLQKALEYLETALDIDIFLFGRNSILTAGMLNNIALVYQDMGDLVSAKDYLMTSIEITMGTYGEIHEKTATRVNNLGMLYYDMGDYEMSLEFLELAVRIYSDLLGEEHPSTGLALINAASVLDDTHDYDKALEYYNRAEKIYLSAYGPKHIDTANMYSNIASHYYNLDDYEKSIETYTKAINAVCPEEMTTPDDVNDCINIAETLIALRGRAVSELMAENYVAAAADYKASAIAMDRLRGGIESEESKKVQIAKYFTIYPEGVNALVHIAMDTGEKKYREEAVEFAELGIGRVFLEMLGRSVAKLDGGLPREVIAEGNELRAAVKEAELEVVSEEQKPRGERSQSARTAAYEKLHEAEKELAEYDARLLEEYPAFAELMNPTPAPLSEIREKVLGPGEAALVLYLGDIDSFGMLVTPDDVIIKVLDGRDTIDNLVKMYRTKLTNPNTPESSLARTGKRLYEELIGPMADELDGFDALLIVPTGMLYFLPFEAIVMDENGEDKYLVERFDIRYAPSLNVALFTQTRGIGPRASADTTPQWLGFGDPVYFRDERAEDRGFSENTERMLEAYTRALSTDDERAAAAAWTRIPGTGEEVKSIASLFDGATADDIVKTGFEATEHNIKVAAESGPDFLHIASHGSLGEGGAQQPALVLSLVGNDETEEDGFLTMTEVFNMKVPARMVVLSACETGRGKMERGEGVAGLSRAFLYAGADSLLVSLWSVADKETKDLMIQFYRNILDGADREKSLASVKREFIKEGMAPYYWAPFVFIGKN